MSQLKKENITKKDQAAVTTPTASAMSTPSHLPTPLKLPFIWGVLDVEPSKVNLNKFPTYAELLRDGP